MPLLDRGYKHGRFLGERIAAIRLKRQIRQSEGL